MGHDLMELLNLKMQSQHHIINSNVCLFNNEYNVCTQVHKPFRSITYQNSHLDQIYLSGHNIRRLIEKGTNTFLIDDKLYQEYFNFLLKFQNKPTKVNDGILV